MVGKIVGHGATKRYLLDGVECSKEEFDGALPDRPAEAGPCSLSATPPNVSDALAVHPSQIPEAMEDAKKRGVPVEFDPEFGRPIFRSRAQQKAYCKAYGFVNRDGGYGD